MVLKTGRILINVMAAALASGRYRTDSLIDATPFRVANKTIRDKHDLGTIDLSDALARSMNSRCDSRGRSRAKRT